MSGPGGFDGVVLLSAGFGGCWGVGSIDIGSMGCGSDDGGVTTLLGGGDVLR